jgi:hypothetical protein
LSCGPSEVQLFDTGCTRLGPACPASGWATDLVVTPTVAVLFVKAGAIAGDGSKAAPYGSIAEAMAHASPGEILALSGDRFDEAAAVSISSDLTLWGACSSSTRIRAPSGAPTLLILGGRVTVRNLGLEPNMAGIAMSSGSLTVRAVDIAPGGAVGISGAGTVEIDAAGLAVAGQRGSAINLTGGARANLASLTLTADQGDGLLLADPGTHAVVNGLLITGPTAVATGAPPVAGVRVFQGASLEMSRAWISGVEGGGLYFIASPGPVSLADLFVDRTSSVSADPSSGTALVAVGGALSIERAVLAHNVRGLALDTVGPARVSDLIVDDSRLGALYVHESSSVSVHRARITQSRAFGLEVLDSRLSATDLSIRATTATTAFVQDLRGSALYASHAAIDLSRVELDRNKNGLWILGTTATIADVAVRGSNGIAQLIGENSTVALARVRVSGSTGAQALTCDSARVVLTDARFDRTVIMLANRASTVLASRVLSTAAPASVELSAPLDVFQRCSRVGFEQSSFSGVAFIAISGAELTGSDLRVDGVQVEGAIQGHGRALRVDGVSSVALHRFELTDSSFGLYLQAGAKAQIADGKIGGDGIGLYQEGQSCDVRPFVDGVLYTGNHGSNFDCATPSQTAPASCR